MGISRHLEISRALSPDRHKALSLQRFPIRLAKFIRMTLPSPNVWRISGLFVSFFMCSVILTGDSLQTLRRLAWLWAYVVLARRLRWLVSGSWRCGTGLVLRGGICGIAPARGR
jgi:hypothetical protein